MSEQPRRRCKQRVVAEEAQETPTAAEEVVEESMAKNREIKGGLQEKASDASKSKSKKEWVIAAIAVLAVLIAALLIGVINSSPSRKYQSA